MAKSIIQSRKGQCYLCVLFGQNNQDNRTDLEEHHVIFGTAGRKFSEKYGLKVYLCQAHHRTGSNAVHKDKEVALLLKQIGQYAFECKYDHAKFMAEWGKNYIDVED